MEPRLRATMEQFLALIDFMERYGDLSKPAPGLIGRNNCELLWMQLTKILNSIPGGVQKPLDKWKKVWADWKTKTKKKYINKCDGLGRFVKITALEERVVAVMGVTKKFDQIVTQEQDYKIGSATEQSPGPSNTDDIVLENHSNQNIVTPDIYLIQSPQVKEETILVTPASLPSLSPTPSQNHNFIEENNKQPVSSQFSTTSRRASVMRRNRRLHTPFERVAEQFAVIERRRLMYEEERDKRLHEREMERIKLEAERLRLETERLEVTRQQTSLLHQLSHLGQRLIEVMTEQQTASLLSTDPER
ncbi:unnamed protein product [Spodoptera littoralis]|uniref:Regulatory protein zeste n=1 Tax=Spodoptera littoralis TaxID=7109 RepID=A0A9P0N0T8_SPOLI|nr:unnamed protein product [Spodoptera littoralis]CAH1638283.1 unnamed protein product [Spodoptera littoralis]